MPFLPPFTAPSASRPRNARPPDGAGDLGRGQLPTSPRRVLDRKGREWLSDSGVHRRAGRIAQPFLRGTRVTDEFRTDENRPFIPRVDAEAEWMERTGVLAFEDALAQL